MRKEVVYIYTTANKHKDVAQCYRERNQSTERKLFDPFQTGSFREGSTDVQTQPFAEGSSAKILL